MLLQELPSGLIEDGMHCSAPELPIYVGNLSIEAGSGSSAALGIGEHMPAGEIDVSEKFKRLFEILFRFPGEADDDIGGDSYTWNV